MLKDLLEKDYLERFGITSDAKADVASGPSSVFDIDDMPSPIRCLPEGQGKVTFENGTYGEIEIVAYEHFVDQCMKPRSFLRGRKRCDYLLLHPDSAGYIILLEITSALGTNDSLTKSTAEYPGGKYEKVEHQLFNSLRDLLSVPAIEAKAKTMQHRICLMGYKIHPHTDPTYLKTHPYARYLSIESKVTGDDGAIVPCPMIESLDFEYRRISHGYVFKLV